MTQGVCAGVSQLPQEQLVRRGPWVAASWPVVLHAEYDGDGGDEVCPGRDDGGAQAVPSHHGANSVVVRLWRSRQSKLRLRYGGGDGGDD